MTEALLDGKITESEKNGQVGFLEEESLTCGASYSGSCRETKPDPFILSNQ